MSDLEVYSIALTTRFRGIDVREGVLLRGDAGWGEFSPFLEYDDPTAAPWLAAALEAAELGWPDPVRTRVPVNVTVPACSPEQARDWVSAEHPRAWAPRQLVVVEEIPLLGNGKVDRVALTGLVAEGERRP